MFPDPLYDLNLCIVNRAVAAGIILYAIGYTQVIIADITTLKWRGLVLSLNSLPFLVNAFLGSNISAAIIEHAGWRWGYGMFIILIPVALAPLITTLLWSENITRRLRSDAPRHSQKTYIQRLVDTAEELDAIGLLLIGTSISLILLPLSLVQHAKGKGIASGMIFMFLLGIILIPIFAMWDFGWAKYPVIPRRFVVNKSVVGASVIGFFDFMSFYLTFTYLYSFIVVVKDWKLINATYFMQTQTIAMTLCATLAGVYMHLYRRYKVILVSSLCVRLVGVVLMLRSRGADGSNFELLLTQVLQGMGVPHGDVAMVTAVVLLFTEFGAAGGGAIAAAIWTSQMSVTTSPLSATSVTSRTSKIIWFHHRSCLKTAWGSTYSDVMADDDWYLGDMQNAVDDSVEPDEDDNEN
ncbi:hypothetical protein C8J57DRAFT_1506822 [Mycena rebaudengoi]|nr:hypothetical protein C8J57DRAFT_1506822 [Mycena rebaudengoi]